MPIVNDVCDVKLLRRIEAVGLTHVLPYLRGDFVSDVICNSLHIYEVRVVSVATRIMTHVYGVSVAYYIA